MRKKQKVADMAEEVLVRQAKTRADRTGDPFEGALRAVMDTEAGCQPGKLRNGPHRDETPRERTEERADALGWSSPNKVAGSAEESSRRGLR